MTWTRHYLFKYYFLDPGSQVSDPDVGDPVFLLLSQRAEASVITYEEVKEAAIGKMIVPFIEAGFPGDLPLDQVETIMSVTIARDPDQVRLVRELKLAGRAPAPAVEPSPATHAADRTMDGASAADDTIDAR